MSINTKKHKFNALDAILLIMIIALIGAAVFFFVVPRISGMGDKSKTEGEHFTVEYELQFRDVPNELRGVIERKHRIGETVYELNSSNELGTLTEIRFENASYTGTDLTDGGKLIYGDYPDHSDVTMVIRAEAEISKTGRYTINDGRTVSVGTGVTVKLPFFTDLGYCTKFSIIDESAGEVE